MSKNKKIKTKCPICEAHYRVPASALGQKARCGKCHTKFQIFEYREHKRHPTEDDILRWLNEEIDEIDTPVRPRIIKADLPAAEPVPVAANISESPDSESADSTLEEPSRRLQISPSELTAIGKLFRKTG